MSYRKGSRKSNSHHYYVPQPPPPPPPPARAYSPSPPQSVRSYDRPPSVRSAHQYSAVYAEPGYKVEPAAEEYPLGSPCISVGPLPSAGSIPAGEFASDMPRSDHSWAVEPVPIIPISPRAARPSVPPSPCGSFIGYSPARAPSVAPSVCEGPYEHVQILPRSPEMGAPLPIPDVHATSVRRLISNAQACFRQYHALHAAVEALSRADCSVVGHVVPEVIVLDLGAGARAAEVVGALTGVELTGRGCFVIRPISWDVRLRGEDPVNLSSVEDSLREANQQDLQGAIRLTTVEGCAADLIVHDLADEALLPFARTILKERACAIVVVQRGNGPLPPTVSELDPTGERTIVVEDTPEPHAWKAELSKLDDILSSILRSRISATIASLTSRIDDVRKELKALPAAQVDATSQLMKLVVDFSGDIFGIGAKRVTQGSFLQQVREEYDCLSRDVKDTIPHFTPAPPCPPSPPFAPHGMHMCPSDSAFAPRSPMCSQAATRRGSFASSRPGSVVSQRGHIGFQPATVNGLPPHGGLAPLGFKFVCPSNDVTFSSVSMRLQLLRREELPGHFPVDKLCRAMVDECVCQWANIAEQRVQSVAQMVVHRASARIQSLFGPYRDSGLSGKISDILRERIRNALRAAKAAIHNLATMEGSFNVQDEEGFLTAKERWDRQYSRDFQQPPGALRVQNLTRAATLDVMATVSAYLEIAHHRFVDGINRAVDAHVIHALDQDIAPVIVATLKQREAGKWLEPSTEIASERAALQDRLEALVRAREEVMLCALG